MSEILKVTGAAQKAPFIAPFILTRGKNTGEKDVLKLKQVSSSGVETVQSKVYTGMFPRSGDIVRYYPNMGDLKVTLPFPNHMEHNASVIAGVKGESPVKLLDVTMREGDVIRINEINSEVFKGKIKLPNSAKRLFRLAGEFITKIK